MLVPCTVGPYGTEATFSFAAARALLLAANRENHKDGEAGARAARMNVTLEIMVIALPE